MSDEFAHRVELSKRVMASIAMAPRRPTLMKDEDGEAHVIVALPNEYAGAVFDRAASAGKRFNIVVAYAKRYEVFPFTREGDHGAPDLVINHDLSMGLLSIKIHQNRGKRIRLAFRNATIDAPVMDSQMAYAAR